jgi:predicted Zn-dependent protease
MPPNRIRKPLRIERDFLESLARRCPDRPEVLRPLADLYTRVGQIAEGLEVDQRLTRLLPHDALAWYNLGCSLALSGDPEQALEALARAARNGYRDRRWMLQDGDLKSLRGDPRFLELIERL